MKQFLSLSFFLLMVNLSQSQNKLYTVNQQGLLELTQLGASELASLPLKCIDQQFPNKTNHTSLSDSDHVLLPKELHPAFYGCFDWHSCVHGHWMLIRLLKLFPQLPEGRRIREVLNATLTAENILGELKYFSLPLTNSWERTYGWAWLLELDEELRGWKDADALRWHASLQPLTRKIVELWMNFLPKQTYANRTGVHPNTAFGLVFALKYARKSGDTAFERAIVQASKELFLRDKAAPTQWEPNGADFLSPSLEEADLMRLILPKQEFIHWLKDFIPENAWAHLLILPVVSDRADLQIVHLDGLCCSRSWCLANIANLLPDGDPLKKLVLQSARAHLESALPHVLSGEYGGEHWLASFAVLALTGQ
jgi:hypothetical protein